MCQQNLPLFLSEKEPAVYLSVSLSTIRRWRRSGDGPAFFRYGGVIRYSLETLQAFIFRYTSEVA
jgi:hypothetical protein